MAKAQPISPHAGPAPAAPSGDALKGIALMVVFGLIAPGIDIFAKLATETVPPGQVAVARFAIQAAVLIPVVLALGLLRRIALPLLGLHALRGILMGIATTAFIWAVKHMPVADAISIFFVAPLMITLLSAWLLGEAVGSRRIAACAVGFVGALIVVRPSFEDLGWVALLPLVTAFTFSFYVLLTRRLAQGEHPLVMQTYAGIFGAALVGLALVLSSGTGSAVFDPVWPDLQGWLFMGGVGVMATVSHLFLVYAYRYAAASTLAPLQYLEIVSATAFGYWVFGDFPDAVKWLGIAIIVGSGLFIIWRERRAA